MSTVLAAASSKIRVRERQGNGDTDPSRLNLYAPSILPHQLELAPLISRLTSPRTSLLAARPPLRSARRPPGALLVPALSSRAPLRTCECLLCHLLIRTVARRARLTFVALRGHHNRACHGRPDMRALSAMLSGGLCLYRDKRIEGPVPGISVGETFSYRAVLIRSGRPRRSRPWTGRRSR
jgi:hypothetical protein